MSTTDRLADDFRRIAVGAILWVLASLSACGSVGPARTFAAISDHQTTAPRMLAERGFAPLAAPPPAVGWTLDVFAYSGGRHSARYEMRGKFRQDASMPDPGTGLTQRLEPVFSGAEIVDDEGRRFPCVRARVPVGTEGGERGEDDAPGREFTWVFEVSGSYDFRRVQFVAVHWGFTLEGQLWEITSRFRVA
jgi:hypothetical protein